MYNLMNSHLQQIEFIAPYSFKNYTKKPKQVKLCTGTCIMFI